MSSSSELGRIAAALERLVELAEAHAKSGAPPRRSPQTRRVSTARARGRSFVCTVLRDGPLLWQEVANSGREFGHSEVTLRRVRGEVADWTKGPDGKVLWHLKDSER